MRFNVRLLETVSMLLSLDIMFLEFGSLKALFLPVELKVNVSCNSGNWEVFVSQFHNFSLNVFVFNTFKIWIKAEIIGNFFVCKLCQSLNLIRRESFRSCFLGPSDRLGDVTIIESLFLFLLFGFLFGGLS